MVECFVLKELKLTARRMVRWEAMGARVTSYDTAQRRRTAELEKRVELSEEQPAVTETALKGNGSRKKEESGSGSENSSGASSWEEKRPKVNRG